MSSKQSQTSSNTSGSSGPQTPKHDSPNTLSGSDPFALNTPSSATSSSSLPIDFFALERLNSNNEELIRNLLKTLRRQSAIIASIESRPSKPTDDTISDNSTAIEELVQALTETVSRQSSVLSILDNLLVKEKAEKEALDERVKTLERQLDGKCNGDN